MAKDIIILPSQGIIEFQDKCIYDPNNIETEQCYVAHPTGSLNHAFKLTYDTTTRRLNFLDDNSTEVFRIDASDNSDGLMVKGDSSITGSLTVTGTLTAQEFKTELVSASILYQSGSTKFGDTSDDVHSFSGSLRVTGSDDHYFTDGNVGIGTTTPNAGLEVANGGDNSTLRITRNGNSSNYLQLQGGSSGAIYNINTSATQDHIFQTGGYEKMRLTSAGDLGIGTASPGAKLDVRGSAVFNEDGGDNDFRVESNGNANMLFVDGGNNRVGIGTNSPGHPLVVQGESTTSDTNIQLTDSSGNGRLQFGYNSDGAFIYGGSTGIGTSVLHIRATNNSPIRIGAHNGNVNLEPGPYDGTNKYEFKAGQIVSYIRKSDGDQQGTSVISHDVYDEANNYTSISFGTLAGNTVSTGLIVKRYSSGNRVGIGTTSPGCKLSVVGAICSSDQIKASTMVATTFTGNLSGNATTATSAGQVNVTDVSDSTNYGIALLTPSNNCSGIGRDSNDKLAFNPATQTLSVDGTAQFTTGSEGFRFLNNKTDNPRLEFSGSSASNIYLEVQDDGALNFQGSSGSLFVVRDSFEGSLFSVNNVSGLPILDVAADNVVTIGKFGENTIKVCCNVAYFDGVIKANSCIVGSVCGHAVSATSACTATSATTATSAGTANCLNSQPASYYLDYNNFTNIPSVDNYGGWNLEVNGSDKGNIASGENINFVGGSNVSLAYSTTDTNTITINSSYVNTNYYLSSAAFNTSDGVLTLGMSGGGSDVTVDLDGRYLLTGGKAADSELLDGVDGAGYLRSNANDTVSERITFTRAGSTTDNDAAIVLQPATNGGSTAIMFRSKVNAGSDRGYIVWYDDNDTYAINAGSGENGLLLIGTQNDIASNTTSDNIVIAPSADLFLNPGAGVVRVGTAASNHTVLTTGNYENTLDGRYYTEAESDAKYLLNTTDTLTGNLTVTGTLTAQEFKTELVSASILYQSGSTKFGDTSDDVHSFSGSLRVTGSGNHYFTDGNVGIGTASPSYRLDVNGDIRATGDLRADDDVFIAGNTLRFTNDAASAYIQSVDTLYLEADSNNNDSGGKPIIFRTAGTTKMTLAGDGDLGIGTTSPGAKLDVRGSAVFNEDSADVDFRVESNGNANMLFVDGGNDRVGIGTNAPSSKFHVDDGDIFFKYNRFVGAGTAYNSVWNRINFYNGGTGDMEITLHSTNWYLRHNANATIAGNVGIGTTTPGCKLSVVGAICSSDQIKANTMVASTFTGNLSGNAATATKWANARTITLGGDLTGNVSIDGSNNVTLTAAVVDSSHNHSNYVKNNEAIQNFNPWSTNKSFDLGTNRFLGKSELLYFECGSTNLGNLTALTDGGYEGGVNLGTAGGNEFVLMTDFETNGLTNSNGYTYSYGFINIHFYPGRHPEYACVRFRDRDGTYTAIKAMTKFSSQYSGNVSWCTNVNVGNYLTGIELTLKPNSSDSISFTEFEYHGTRMGLDEGGLLTKAGGTVYGNLSVNNTVDATSFRDYSNTGYYVDPAGTSVLSGLTVCNTITGDISGNAVTATSACTATSATSATSAGTANCLNSQPASYYTNASNLSSGTISDDRLPATISSDITGNAATADKWTTARTLTLGGDLTGNVSIDGSAAISLNATVVNNSHDHSISNITNLQSTLDGKLNLTGGTLTGNITFSDDGEGLVWSRNSDGASIKFYNTGDGDTNSRLEFNTLDNNNEYFRWTHSPSGGTLYESMRLTSVSATNARLCVDGYIRASKQLVSAIANGTAPIVVTSSTLVNNLNADKLDGQEGSYYTNASNLSSGTISDNRLPATISSDITGNAATADKLTNARTIGLTGGVSGDADFDGSGNITISTVVANNSHTLAIACITNLQTELNGKDNYSSWDLTVGAVTESITSGYGLTVAGGGATSVSLNANTSTLTISSTDTNTTYSAGTGLALSGTSFSLSHLGIQNLTDPNADRILFWDDSATATAWLTLGSNLSISGTTLNATDTNTTYSAGVGLALSGTTFRTCLTEIGTGTVAQVVGVDGSGNDTRNTIANVIGTPSAPSIAATESSDTVSLAITSFPTDAHRLEVYRSQTSSTVGFALIGIVEEADIAASMTVIDDSYTSNTTLYYRAYAVRHGKYSTAGTASVTPSNTVGDVSNLAITPFEEGFILTYDLPSDRRLSSVTIKKQALASNTGFSEGSATTVYTGLANSFVYRVADAEVDYFHKFWISTTTA